MRLDLCATTRSKLMLQEELCFSVAVEVHQLTDVTDIAQYSAERPAVAVQERGCL